MSAKRISVTLSSEMLLAIDKKAKDDALTHQQILVALIDLGLNRTTYPDRGELLGVLESIELLRRVQGKEAQWAREQLRDALWGHLTALVGGG